MAHPHWVDQPRWPHGTPIAPGGHGPGGGRWSPEGAPAVPLGGWATRLLGPGIRIEHYLERQDYRVLNGDGQHGGAQGHVEHRLYPDGTHLAYKQFRAHGAKGRHEALAEQESSIIAEAIGAPVPAVRIDPHNPDAVLMDWIDGAHVPRGDNSEMVETEAGARLALLDILIDNRDRHRFNWLATLDGPVGIDHGLALARYAGRYMYDARFRNPEPDRITEEEILPFGDFQRAIIRQNPDEVVGHRQQAPAHRYVQFHYSRQQLEQFRRQIEGIREQLRPEVYAGVLRTLDVLVGMTV